MQVLAYSQESGIKAGGGEYINEGGAYVGTITEAKYTKAQTGTDGLEFSFAAEDGMKANYLRVYFAKKPAVEGQAGEPIKGGVSLLNAMLGILRLPAMTAVENKTDKSWRCPEFEGKKIGLFLQKVNYTKADQSTGYKFEIAVPFHPTDRKTLRELVEQKPATMIDRMTANYKDKDEKNNTAGSTQTGAVGGYDNVPDGW